MTAIRSSCAILSEVRATLCPTPTADRFVLKDRGYVKPGYFADFTVFDEDETKNATPDQTKSFGIKKVFINGELVLDNDELNKSALKTTGRALTV